jgi:gluconate 2-dehydrogenase gamma chain
MFLNSRRTFLKSTFLTTAVIVMSGTELFGAVSPLQTISAVHEDLFPYAKKLGINSASYLKLILNHSRITEREKAFLRNGVQWLNEEAVLQYKQTYTKLSASQRQNILQIISKERWGENWINAMLTYIMEATLGDPIYRANKNGAGWTWLHHTSGLPRPTKVFL